MNIPLEKYLRGVVPSEMHSSWEHEAHKAQAIAARSYAIANRGKRAKYGYDLKDTPEDQAYGGASAEKTNTNEAVEETSGIVLVCQGKMSLHIILRQQAVKQKPEDRSGHLICRF